MSFAEYKKSGSKDSFEAWKAKNGATANADGKPVYIAGESMTQYNNRVAQWMKTKSMERGTQAAFMSKDKRPDTGTSVSTHIGVADAGEYANEPMATASDASLGHGGGAADAGTFENTPTTYAQEEAPAGGYDQGGYEHQGYEEQQYDQGY
jgi:hypothetical protein